LYAKGRKVWRGCAGKLRTKVGIKETVSRLPKLIDKEEAKNKVFEKRDQQTT
jgi:hypothetical protein